MWMKNLVETYEKLNDLGNEELIPLSHSLKKMDVKIILNESGIFLRLEKLNAKIIIPVTEKSASRSSGISPHPLHENTKYLFSSQEIFEVLTDDYPELTDEQREMVSQDNGFDDYKKLFCEWNDGNAKLDAVYNYINSGKLRSDLTTYEVQGVKVLKDKSGKIKTKAKGKPEVEYLNIAFSVEIKGDLYPDLWKDKVIQNLWNGYYTSSIDTENLCYITGEVTNITNNHPKGINADSFGAKLISANDNENFTFRGRFSEANQANSIGYDSSRKAHAMLTYLVFNYGFKCDTGVIVTYSLGEDKNLLKWHGSTDELIDELDDLDEKEIDTAETILDRNYAKRMRNTFLGFGKAEKLKKHENRIAIIALDAATTGRLSVTYYQELEAHEFHEKIVEWHENCHWHMEKWVGDKKNRKKIHYISAPKVDDMIWLIYGVNNQFEDEKSKSYQKIQKQAREQMLYIMFSGKKINRNYIASSLRRTSNPFSFQNKNGSFSESNYINAVNVTCALMKMHYHQEGVEFSMELDKNETDRSYLYGRLLAYAEQIETWARNQRDETGYITNSLRYRSRFSQKPFSTWMLLDSQLNPYREILKGMVYERQMGEILSLFSEGDYESDKPLDGKYLMGYSLQRLEFRPNNNK